MNKFTLPKLSTKGNSWFVWFRFYDDSAQKWVLHKFTGNYNRIADKKERRKALQSLADAWRHKLEKESYNPITNTYRSLSIGPLKSMSFVKAIAWAQEKRAPRYAYKSNQDYGSVIKYLTAAAQNINLGEMFVSEMRKAHFKLILDAVQSSRKLSAAGYNKYKSYLSSLVTELAEYDIIEANPIYNIKDQQQIKIHAHAKPTEKEREIITRELQANYKNFYRFCSVIYGTTIRVKETLALQVRDFHPEEQVIRIVPNRERNNSKTFTEREIIVPDTIAKLFEEMGLSNAKPTDYIFSKDYLPGPKRLHSNTPTANWREIVKEGLKIKKDLYGLKKLAGDDMIDLQTGVKDLLELPRRQMGHTDSKTTEVYVTKHKEVLADLLRKETREL